MTTASFPASPGRKTLIFHIGDHKTGSTSIQYAFARKAVTLSDRSVLYPAQISHNGLAMQFKAHSDTAPPKARQAAAEMLTKLANRLRNSKTDFCLISAESIESVSPALFQNMIETYFADCTDEIRIVAYVRPHAARLVSSFAERIKIGKPKTLDTDLDGFFRIVKAREEFLYHPRFAAWRDTFGDRFLLRPMIREHLHRGSVVEDFIHHAFGGIGYKIAETPSANESLALPDLMRLKVLQSHLIGDTAMEVRRALGWEFSRISGLLPPLQQRARLQLHRELAAAVHDAYLEDARRLDTDFFGTAPLMATELERARDQAVAAPHSVDPADHLSDGEIRSLDILSTIIGNMLQNEATDWGKALRRKRVRAVTP